MCAMSGTSGSSGFGSHSKEHMDNRTGRKKDPKSVYTQVSVKLKMTFSMSSLILHLPIQIQMDML